MRRPSSRGLTQSAVVAALLGLAPALAPGQEVAVESPAALRLRVTTASEEAARHFWAGVGDARNIFFSRATTHFDRAIAIDSNLGLARVLRATMAPGLTQDERTAEVDRGLATLTSGATGEIVTALAFRESVAGHMKQAQALFQAATQILPGDPHLAFYAAQATANADGPTRGVEAFRVVTEKFPDDAPSHNILAYLLWQTGDRDGAYTAVKRYVELAPDQPNAHDSHAELLQWDNRFSEALAHYGRAAELDSNYIEAYAGMAEVFQLTGRGRDARAMLQRAMARAPSTPARINHTRAVAHSFLLDGMLREGTERLTVAAREARAENRPVIATLAYRQLAVADALMGRGTGIATHLKEAAEVGGADAPEQLATIAIAHGTTGDLATARDAAQKLATVARTRTQFATVSRAANAVLLLRENRHNEALNELGGADADDPLVRALRAECHRAAGNLAEARMLRTQVLTDPRYSLFDAYATLARIRAARIKI